VELGEGLAGEFEKLVGILAERVAREGLEFVDEAGVGVALRGQQGVEPGLLRLEFGKTGAQRRQIGFGFLELLPQHALARGQRGGGGPEPEPGNDGADGGGGKGDEGFEHGRSEAANSVASKLAPTGGGDRREPCRMVGVGVPTAAGRRWGPAVAGGFGGQAAATT